VGPKVGMDNVEKTEKKYCEEGFQDNFLNIFDDKSYKQNFTKTRRDCKKYQVNSAGLLSPSVGK
jgi:hypothetical protein